MVTTSAMQKFEERRMSLDTLKFLLQISKIYMYGGKVHPVVNDLMQVALKPRVCLVSMALVKKGKSNLGVM